MSRTRISHSSLTENIPRISRRLHTCACTRAAFTRVGCTSAAAMVPLLGGGVSSVLRAIGAASSVILLLCVACCVQAAPMPNTKPDGTIVFAVFGCASSPEQEGCCWHNFFY